MTAPAVVVVTDHPTPDEIRTALGHMCHRAKREMPVVGSAERPTPWDQRHKVIDGLLTDLLEGAP